MLYLVSQFGTLNLGGGCFFPEGYFGSFRSGPSRDCFGEGVGSEILEESWMEESSCDVLGALSGEFSGKSCEEDYEWDMW